MDPVVHFIIQSFPSFPISSTSCLLFLCCFTCLLWTQMPLLQTSVLLSSKLWVNSAKHNDTKFCFIHFYVYLGFQISLTSTKVTVLTWEDWFYFLPPYLHLLDNWYLNLLETPFPHHSGPENGAKHSNI